MGGDFRYLHLPLHILITDGRRLCFLPYPWGIAPLAPPAEGLLLPFREWWPGFPHPFGYAQQSTTQLSRYPGTPLQGYWVALSLPLGEQDPLLTLLHRMFSAHTNESN